MHWRVASHAFYFAASPHALLAASLTFLAVVQYDELALVPMLIVFTRHSHSGPLVFRDAIIIVFVVSAFVLAQRHVMHLVLHTIIIFLIF